METVSGVSERRHEGAYDVVVVGGGAAGLSAALTLGRARRSVLVVDDGRPRNAPAEGMHNYLGHEGLPPGRLLEIGRREAAGYGVEFAEGAAVTARRDPDADVGAAGAAGAAAGGGRAASGDGGEGVGGREGRGVFVVGLDGGREVRSRRLLVTTGLVDELPDVPGLAERWGREVLHCPYCHGWEVRDRRLGVLATSSFAVEQALLWRQWSDAVTLFTHIAPEPDGEARERLAARGVAVVEGKVSGLRVDDGRLAAVTLADGRAVPVEAVVVAPRFTARAGVLAGLGVAAREVEMGGQVVGAQVPADSFGATAVPGVWVAGNVAAVFETVIGSAAAGVRAAGAINADLVAEDTRLALAAHRSRS